MSEAEGLGHDLTLLRQAVEDAGRLALEHFRARRGHWYKGPGQVLTEADLEVDRLLRARLLDARPEDAWLSEETPDDGSRHACERVWVVDPIDGTRAFADGVPEFAISVALLERSRPLLGAVFNPATDELFLGWRGHGAFLGERRLQVTGRTALEGAKLLSARTEMRRRRWPEHIEEAEFSSVGSLAYKLALVADGRYDGLVSLRASHDWDLAAALLLIEEAGGLLTEADGSPLRLNQATPRHAGLIAAATPDLHGALVERLAEVARRTS